VSDTKLIPLAPLSPDVVSRENKLVALFALLALLAGTIVASVPGLPEWADIAAVVVLGVVIPQLWFGYRESASGGG
jgi:hypothetical protein